MNIKTRHEQNSNNQISIVETLLRFFKSFNFDTCTTESRTQIRSNTGESFWKISRFSEKRPHECLEKEIGFWVLANWLSFAHKQLSLV